MPASAIVGREREVGEVISRLATAECRLLTIVGPGGTGKTRLAIEVARRLAPDAAADSPFADGVFLISLQSVTSVNSIFPAIANSIDFEFYEVKDAVGQLASHLKDKDILLVLDNFEQLLAGAERLAELLASAAGLKLLLTSREPLKLRDEWSFQLAGLPVPETAAEAAAYGSVQLFAARARRVQHDFSLAENLEAVADLCRLVHGVPLAIELAATWLRALSCAEIVAEVRKNLDILTTDLRDVPERHRSIRAVFDYSWALLTPAEQRLFMSLAVFRGGFRRAAAAAVTGATLPELAALVDKSLLIATATGRYEIHELTWQYAAERLAEEPDMDQAVRDAHSAHYLGFMDRPFKDFYGFDSRTTLQEIDADIENVLAAWYWAIKRRQYGDLHRAVEGIYHYGFLRIWHNNLDQALNAAVSMLQAEPPGRRRDITLGWILSFRASTSLWLSRPGQTRSDGLAAIEILEPHDARRELAGAYVARAWAIRFEPGRDPAEARAVIGKAADLLEETRQFELQGFMFAMLAGLHYDIGEYKESERWYQQALTLSRRIEDPRNEASTLVRLGRLNLTLGKYGLAREYLLQSLELARQLKNPGEINAAQNRLGEVAVATGAWEVAQDYFDQCLANALKRARPYEITYTYINLSSLHLARRAFDRARIAVAAAEANAHGSQVLTVDTLFIRGRIAFHDRALADAAHFHAESLRICEENNFRRQRILNLDALAQSALAQGDRASARECLRSAVVESKAVGVAPEILDVLVSGAELLAASEPSVAAALGRLVAAHEATKAVNRPRAERLANLAPPAGAAPLLLPEAADLLLARLEGAAAPAPAASSAAQPLTDPLSERELELLRLVAAGRSNREIAVELTLALGTVKSHLNHVFQKLAVRRRTEAVARARELELL